VLSFSLKFTIIVTGLEEKLWGKQTDMPCHIFIAYVIPVIVLGLQGILIVSKLQIYKCLNPGSKCLSFKYYTAERSGKCLQLQVKERKHQSTC
jgi:hypothetical protein